MPRGVEVRGSARGIGEGAGSDTEAHRGTPGAGLVGQVDPVEPALVEALTRAAEAEEWSVISVLADELTARRKNREAAQAEVLAGSNVSSLEAARSRRGLK